MKFLLICALSLVLKVPVMSETVWEYMHPVKAPAMSETVEEYVSRGKEWASKIDMQISSYLSSIQNREDEYSDYELEDSHVEDVQVTSEEVTSSKSASVAEGMIYYSNMELTAYIWTGNPCADGVYPQVGYTVACNDPSLWHRWIYIEGHGTYYVHDTGGMSSNVIDIYVGDYDSAVQFGRRSANVYIVE